MADMYEVDDEYSGAHEEGFYFLPLGGTGEIGMNLNLYAVDGKWIMVDLGVSFRDEKHPGLDVIMPDPSFIEEKVEDLLALVVTHGHEDHIGAIPYLWERFKCPVYATPFTASLVRRKLAEVDLLDQVELNIVPLQGEFTVGPFRLQYITLTHSIPEPNALAIHTKYGTVLHTGDWKIDPDPLVGDETDISTLTKIGDQGVLAMVCDSTNALKEKPSGSEADVRNSLMELVGKYPTGKVVVGCFASNVARLETLAKVAQAHGRFPILAGRSLFRMDEVARENGYLSDLPPFVRDRDAESIPPEKQLILCTGSQGEPRAALTRIANKDHPFVSLDQGDVVFFSSRVIPGNEKSIFELQNKLARLGVEIVTEKDAFIHVSGHPSQEELAQFYNWIRPDIAIPVHGEFRHLTAHAELAKKCKVKQSLVIDNGDMVRLAPGHADVVAEVDTGRLTYDGGYLWPVNSDVIKDRQRLLFNGSAAATVVVSKQGQLRGHPIITLQGIAEDQALDELEDYASELVEESVNGLKDELRGGDTYLSEAIRQAVRRAVRKETGKKPLTTVHLIRL